uniref:Box C/D snoRNA protein 1 n=1 Tax=Caenorhabditis japonica TaxID=281687 RepID=A0A8R1DLR6_CAEJA
MPEEVLSGHEEGEILDDDDDVPSEMPTNKPDLLINYPSSDEEEPSEDVIKAFAAKQKMIEETKKAEVIDVDPKLCKVCVKNEHKYRCPRCDIRTCSLDCSKKHKTDNECDGVRQPFTKVDKLSQYDSQKSIDDQKFMQSMKDKAGLGTDQAGIANSEVLTNSDGEEKPVDPNALRYTTNSPTERYLLNAARFRHVWLGYTDAAGNESRHEQHSDTIFWNVKLTFKKQISNGDVEVFEKTVLNIPETIRLVTVLKQFFRPRQYGCIVSESDLDVEKLKPFIEGGIENVNVYMEVHGQSDRFYGVIADQTILESTRSRVVADHPKFVITLKDEFVETMQLLSSEELAVLQSKYGGFSVGGGGRGRGGGGGRGFHRGGGRGGGGGGGGQHHNNFRVSF